MVSAGHLLGFALTAFVLIIVPGPSVLFVVGRALAFGRRPAVLTAVGNAVGVFGQVVVIALGLGTLLAHSIVVFDAVKLAGALYLVVLGVQAIRSSRRLASLAGEAPGARPAGRTLREGFVVGITNPKATVLFAAIAPQFVDPADGPVALQLLVLGGERLDDADAVDVLVDDGGDVGEPRLDQPGHGEHRLSHPHAEDIDERHRRHGDEPSGAA